MPTKTKHTMIAELLKRFNSTDFDVNSVYESVFTEDAAFDAESDTGMDLSEATTVLFEGAEMTDELKAKTVVVFEAAVAEKTSTEVSKIEKNLEESTDKSAEDAIIALTENVDKYMSHVAEEWMKSNEVTLDHNLKLDVAEDLIEGLKALFTEHNVFIPAAEVSEVAKLAEENADLKAKLNESTDKIIDLKKTNLDKEVELAFNEAAEGLVMTQSDRFKSLVEGLEFSDIETYVTKINIVKEQYFSDAVETTDDVEVNEDVDVEADEAVVNPEMDVYTKSISASQKY